MSIGPRPTPEQQLAFLQRIQKLFEDGDFTATYKFALLMSLAELAVEYGEDDGSDLELDIMQVGEKFVELYWPQTVPYSSGVVGTSADILIQNQGIQATVINELRTLRQAGANTLPALIQMPQWHAAVVQITSVVRQMPIQYLQNIGGTMVPFLYDYPPPRGKLILKPGVPFLLRTFHGLIHQLARAGWIAHIRQNHRNAKIIGQTDDLESFMFGTPRQNLQGVAKFLLGLQSHLCFYCGSPIQGASDVDHFLPWSKYPRDLAHNFVLAHAVCNRRKSDMLAAQPHLDRWLERNEKHCDEISGVLAAIGFIADNSASQTVARWAYKQAVETSGIAWLRDKVTEPITDRYLEAFSDC